MTGPKPNHGDLTRAAQRKDLDDVRRLLSQGADVNEVFHSVTPLIRAAQGGDSVLVSLLLQNGAAVDSPERISGDTPLHRAASAGHVKAMEVLVKAGAEIDARNSDGVTPLIAAAMSGKMEAVRYLVEQGADVAARDMGHETAESVARRMKYNDVADFLHESMEQALKKKRDAALRDKTLESQRKLHAAAARRRPQPRL